MKIYLLFMLTVFCASCRNDGKPILPLLDADDFSTTVDGKQLHYIRLNPVMGYMHK